VTQHQTIVEMVRAGLGVALLPTLSLGDSIDVAQV
jgi:DNA-binding transcriptional LysR family regulator